MFLSHPSDGRGSRRIPGTKMEQVPEDTNYELQFSVQSNLLFQNAYAFLESSNAEVLDIPHVVQAMLLLPESWACYFLKNT